MITVSDIDFAKGLGLVPVIVQDHVSREVLMLGYMNEEAFQHTCEHRNVTFFSRSKNRLWTKGETSGNFLKVVSIKLDCDCDTLLIEANPCGPVCHTGTYTCFGNPEVRAETFLSQLESIIDDRLTGSHENSYTAKLVASGIAKVAQKVGEEAVEVVIEAMQEHSLSFHDECADLVFHLLVLLHTKKSNLAEVMKVLAKRHEEKRA